MCTVRFVETLSGDCGTQSYASVFTARVLAVELLSARAGRNVPHQPGVTYPGDLRLTIEPEEVFKGHPRHKIQILAEQGECFAPIRVGDDWLFFGEKSAKTDALSISYRISNPSGPVEQKHADIERLRRLERKDGLGYVVGEVGFTSYDASQAEIFKPQANHRVVLQADPGKQTYSVTTNAEGRFELGPIAPGFFSVDANTDPQFHAVWSDVLGAMSEANGCSFRRIELEINSEISGRVILPDGYQYKKSEIGNYFPLFYVDVDTSEGEQVGGTSIGDGLKFTLRGLAPGSYMLQLVNYSGESWIKTPVYAPGVTDKSTALRIDLGLAEHRTGIEIHVPPGTLKGTK